MIHFSFYDEKDYRMQVGQTYTFYFLPDLFDSPLYGNEKDKKESIAFMNTAFVGTLRRMENDANGETKSYEFLMERDFGSFPLAVKQYLVNNFLNRCVQVGGGDDRREWILHAFPERLLITGERRIHASDAGIR